MGREEKKQLLFIDRNIPTQLGNYFDFSAFWNSSRKDAHRPICQTPCKKSDTVTSDNQAGNQLLDLLFFLH